MAHAQKPDFVFQRNGRVYLNLRGSQFNRLLVAEVCASAVVMLDTPCSEVVWRVLATHSIRQFLLHFPFCASPCAITFQLESKYIEIKMSWGATERTWTYKIQTHDENELLNKDCLPINWSKNVNKSGSSTDKSRLQDYKLLIILICRIF